MERAEQLRLKPEQLRWQCDPEVFGADSTEDLDPNANVIGQDRALKALKLGMELRSPGYNVFIAGFSGTGRMTSIHRILKRLQSHCVEVTDKAYVHNFDAPTRPQLLQFPRGRVRAFQTRMAEFEKHVGHQVPELFDSEEYITQRQQIESTVETEQRKRLEQLSEECRVKGLALVQVKSGPQVRLALGIPQGEEVVPIEALSLLVGQGKLDEERAKVLGESAEPLQEKLQRALMDMRQASRQFVEMIEDFDRNQARAAFKPDLDAIREEFTDAAVAEFLTGVEAYILEEIDVFRRPIGPDGENILSHKLIPLQVNAVLDNSEGHDSPVILESSPTYTNLFGAIERNVSPGGMVWTDHTRIRTGSLLRADGGFLVMSAEEVLMEPGVWPALKRALKFARLEVQEREERASISPLLFQPEPIPLNVKVILIGDTYLYSMLHHADPDFRRTFKVRADFDSVMQLNDETLSRYGSFLARLQREEDLLAFDKSAMARIAEAGVRIAEHGGKISTRFSEIANLAREASYFAHSAAASIVRAEHVERALAESIERDNLLDEKLTERIHEGTVLIATDGTRVGVVNGLTVYDSGRWAFGKPARITATVSAGDQGILNIEREVQLSGEIHDKGVFILTSLLRERFGQRHPLALSASICFEQSYGGIDGDSASSAEYYAVLSALAEVPLRQDLAVTGSINQKGDMQPIGGATEKIEGFFDLCEARGLTGDQGVILPAQNVTDLMLEPRVVQAVAEGKFHVYAVNHVDEAIELLTGMPVGEPDQEGEYPAGTLNGRVAERLMFLAEIARDFKGGPEKCDGEEEPDS